jgi:hypothetical protein
MKHGYGKLALTNGESYTGLFNKGMKDGEGTYYWENGDYYVGQFKLDKREGKGFYHWADGSTYKGEWSRDRMNGIGCLIKREKTVGLFSNDQYVRPVSLDEVGDLKLYIF